MRRRRLALLIGDNFALVRELASKNGCGQELADLAVKSKELTASDAMQVQDDLDAQIPRLLGPSP